MEEKNQASSKIMGVFWNASIIMPKLKINPLENTIWKWRFDYCLYNQEF